MVEYMLVPAYYDEEIIIPDHILKKLKKYKTLGLFAAVQFIKLEGAIEQLKTAGIDVLTSHGKRTSGKFQLLGCDCFSSSFDKKLFDQVDAIFYIGDGLFHPRALVLSQKGEKKPKEVLLFDPIGRTLKNLSLKDLEKDRNKYKANLIKYVDAQNIGVLVTTKPGQQYLKNAIKLKEQEKDKQVYLFIDDTFNYQSMENYPFIDCWVNTACPRIGFDDVRNMPKPLININDALDINSALSRQ